MSTELFGIRVLSVEPDRRRATMRVLITYYDCSTGYHDPLPEDHSFFARVLLEHRSRSQPPGQPSDSPAWDDDYVDSNAHRFIERVGMLRSENFPIEDFSPLSDFYTFRDGEWKDEELLAQADYEVFVTDPAHLESLQAGMCWGSAAYETCADVLTEAEARLVPNLRAQFQVLRPECWASTSAWSGRFSSDGKYFVMFVNNHDLANGGKPSEGAVVVYATESWSQALCAKTRPICERIGIDCASGVAWESGADTGLYDSPITNAWRIVDGSEVPDFQPPLGEIRTADRRFFARHEEEKYPWPNDLVIYVHDPGEEPAELMVDGKRVTGIQVSFSHRGDAMALNIDRTTCTIRSLPSLDHITSVTLDNEVFGSIALSPDSRWLLIGRDQSQPAIVRVSDGGLVRTLRTNEYIYELSWSPNGRYIAIVYETGYATIHRADPG